MNTKTLQLVHTLITGKTYAKKINTEIEIKIVKQYKPKENEFLGEIEIHELHSEKSIFSELDDIITTLIEIGINPNLWRILVIQTIHNKPMYSEVHIQKIVQIPNFYLKPYHPDTE